MTGSSSERDNHVAAPTGAGNDQLVPDRALDPSISEPAGPDTPFDGVYRGRRVLVTGHTGFKGAWLSSWLAKLGAHVTGLALDPPTEPSLYGLLDLSRAIDDVRADIRDEAAVIRAVRDARPDYVFHLAAQSLVRTSYLRPTETFAVNTLGTAHLLEAIRAAAHPCVVVVATTDKVYENREWAHGYRETDRLGGHDPYAASKAAAEIVVASYRRSFFAPAQIAEHGVRLATARAGNVLGGGDWAADRIVPDAIAALGAGRAIPVRNPHSVRPWQHVLDPLSGYLWLGRRLAADGGESLAEAWNFGPASSDVRTVSELVSALVSAWGSGQWQDVSRPDAPHETSLLTLSTDKARHALGWSPTWPFSDTVTRTVDWYRAWSEQCDLPATTLAQIAAYTDAARTAGATWATLRVP